MGKFIEYGFPFKNTNLTPEMLCTCKAEAAARDSGKSKQDHYEEMRRKKDEEREAQERLLVRHYFAVITSLSLSSCSLNNDVSCH
jgi:hypothetical protein